MSGTALKEHTLRLRQEEMKARMIGGSYDAHQQPTKGLSWPDILQPNHDTEKPQDLAFQRHYTIAELAKQWRLSQSTVLRIFKSEPGVIRLGNLKTRKRTKISLRIPEEVAKRVHATLTGGS